MVNFGKTPGEIAREKAEAAGRPDDWEAFLNVKAPLGVSGAVTSSPRGRGGTRKCPFCAEEVMQEAILCKHCRSKIEPSLPINEPVEALVQTQLKVAPRNETSDTEVSTKTVLYGLVAFLSLTLFLVMYLKGPFLLFIAVIAGLTFSVKKINSINAVEKLATSLKQAHQNRENYINSKYNALYQEKFPLMEAAYQQDEGRSMSEAEKIDFAKAIRTHLGIEYDERREKQRQQEQLRHLKSLGITGNEDFSGGLPFSSKSKTSNSAGTSTDNGFLGLGYRDTDLNKDRPEWINASRYICKHCGERFIDPKSANYQGCYRSPRNQHELTAK